MSLVLLSLAYANEPTWLRCAIRKEEIEASTVFQSPLPFDLVRTGSARVRHSLDEVPKQTVVVEAGEDLPELPKGPAIVAVDPKLRVPEIVALYEGMTRAGTEPYFAVWPQERSYQAAYVDDWKDWVIPDGVELTGTPVDGWTAKFSQCAPELVEGDACPDPKAWAEVLLSGRCGLVSPLNRVAIPAKVALGVVEESNLDLSCVPDNTEATWSELQAGGAVSFVCSKPGRGGLIGGRMASTKDTDPDGDGIHEFRASEVEPKRRTRPPYPEGASGSAICFVEVLVASNGKPLAAQVERCGAAFAEAARSATMEWRWAPKKVGRTKVPYRTRIAFRFDK